MDAARDPGRGRAGRPQRRRPRRDGVTAASVGQHPHLLVRSPEAARQVAGEVGREGGRHPARAGRSRGGRRSPAAPATSSRSATTSADRWPSSRNAISPTATPAPSVANRRSRPVPASGKRTLTRPDSTKKMASAWSPSRNTTSPSRTCTISTTLSTSASSAGVSPPSSSWMARSSGSDSAAVSSRSRMRSSHHSSAASTSGNEWRRDVLEDPDRGVGHDQHTADVVQCGAQVRQHRDRGTVEVSDALAVEDHRVDPGDVVDHGAEQALGRAEEQVALQLEHRHRVGVLREQGVLIGRAHAVGARSGRSGSSGARRRGPRAGSAAGAGRSRPPCADTP